MPGKRQNITVSKLVRRGVVRWIVNRVEDGARRRTIFITKKEADAEAVRLRTQIENGGAAWLALSAADRDELVRFHRACQEEGVRFWDLLRAHE
ncbi:MAG: hypothetical protein JNK85_18620, partial [Verrucomicrobiales bacterium]|nr:hypothetical protein [Verrucomicrobiales bacterium]